VELGFAQTGEMLRIGATLLHILASEGLATLCKLVLGGVANPYVRVGSVEINEKAGCIS
jgi:hypothetical protein